MSFEGNGILRQFPSARKKIGDFNFIWYAEKDFEIKALFRVT